jgi:hypothetical protein
MQAWKSGTCRRATSQAEKGPLKMHCGQPRNDDDMYILKLVSENRPSRSGFHLLLQLQSIPL